MQESLNEWRAKQAARNRTCAERWAREQTENLYAAYYLYCLPALFAQKGSVTIAQDTPGPAWMLASPERISPGWTVEQVVAWMNEQCERLPLLPGR